MLAITETAAEAIREITASEAEIDGIRLDAHYLPSENGSGPSAVIEVSAVSGPEVLDEVVEEHGARVYVEPRLAELLDDKVLDVAVEEDHAHFVVTDEQS